MSTVNPVTVSWLVQAYEEAWRLISPHTAA
jgi:hypothetical protein